MNTANLIAVVRAIWPLIVKIEQALPQIEADLKQVSGPGLAALQEIKAVWSEVSKSEVLP